MINDDIQRILQQALTQKKPLTLLQVTSDGNHFQVVVVSELFDGMSRAERQRVVYQPLMPYFSDNRIHALTIKAFTPCQWQHSHKNV